jgi:NAD:arginine ADP-ribosyltransferase
VDGYLLAQPSTQDCRVAAIRGYTTDEGAVADYRRINSALRSRDSAQLARLQPYVDKKQAGLDRLPDHAGTVYRGAHLKFEVIDAYREAARTGQPVVEDAFTSTTTKPAATFGGNTSFIIRSAHGKDVSSISVFGGEREVLFRAGTRFEVESVTQPAAGEHVIMLWEVQ